jgi:hypothetical protein
MMTIENLEQCSERPAFGAVLGDGPGFEADGRTRFVVVYEVRPSVTDVALAARMSSLCAFEN